MRMDRGTDKPVDAIGGGRFEEKRPASAFRLLRKLFCVRASDGSLVLEPVGQRFAIGDRGLPKTQQIANLGAMPLDTPAGQGKFEIGGVRERQFRHDVR